MGFLAIGLSHKTASVAVRERVAFIPEDSLELFRTSGEAVQETVVVSTCNRTEIYVWSARPEQVERQLVNHLQEKAGMDLSAHLYHLREMDAIMHLMNVASGMDSLVLGETQILGQVKDAYLYAREQGMAGRHLTALFESTLACAKRVHRETGIGDNAVSVPYATVQMAKKVFSTLENCSVLLIGAGKMGGLAAEYLYTHGVSEIMVTNRTLSRAEEMATRFGHTVVPYEAMEAYLAKADIVITSTGATSPILSQAMLERVMKVRRGAPLFIFDMAVPRDVEEGVERLASVYLYDMDDFEAVVDHNLAERERQAQLGQPIIAAEAQALWQKEASLEAVPLIRSLREKAEEIRQMELSRALARLPELDGHQREIVQQMSSLIVNKLLNDPTVVMKELAAEDGRDLYLDTIRRLFRLGSTQEAEIQG